MKAPRLQSHLVLAVAAAMLIALFGFLFGRSTVSVNESLVRMIQDLTESAGESTVVAASLLAGSCILAAVLIPLIVTLVAIYADRKDDGDVRQCRAVHPNCVPPGQKRLAPDDKICRRLSSPAGQHPARRSADRRRNRRRPRRRTNRHGGPRRDGKKPGRAG